MYVSHTSVFNFILISILLELKYTAVSKKTMNGIELNSKLPATLYSKINISSFIWYH